MPILREALSVCLEFLVPLIDDEVHGPYKFAQPADKLIQLLVAPLSGSVLCSKDSAVTFFEFMRTLIYIKTIADKYHR